MNIEKEIYQLIDREGGFVNDPDDNGSATKYGITQHTLEMWLGRQVTVEDVKNLPKKTAYEIYYSWYYIKPSINDLPMLIQPVVLDAAVNHGPKKAVKLLQDAVHCSGFNCGRIDGSIGPKTINASHAAVEQLGSRLIEKIINRRVIAYENIVKADDTQRKFLSGWIARAESFKPAAA